MIGALIAGTHEPNSKQIFYCIVCAATLAIPGTITFIFGITSDNPAAIGAGGVLIALPLFAYATAVCCHYACKRFWPSHNDNTPLLPQSFNK